MIIIIRASKVLSRWSLECNSNLYFHGFFAFGASSSVFFFVSELAISLLLRCLRSFYSRSNSFVFMSVVPKINSLLRYFAFSLAILISLTRFVLPNTFASGLATFDLALALLCVPSPWSFMAKALLNALWLSPSTFLSTGLTDYGCIPTGDCETILNLLLRFGDCDITSSQFTEI